MTITDRRLPSPAEAFSPPEGFGGFEPDDGQSFPEALRNWVGIFWRGKWVVLITTLLGLAIGYVVAQQFTPLYSATTKVMLNTRETNVVDIENVLSGLSADAGAVAGEIALITSYQLLDRVVQKFRLAQDREFNPPSKDQPFYHAWIDDTTAILPEGARLALGLGLPGLTPPEAYSPQDAERVAVVGRLAEALEASQDRRAPIINITVTSGNPKKAVLLSNAVAEQYIVDQLEAKFEATQRATAWLNERVAGLKDKLEKSEAAVEAYRASLADSDGQGIELTQQQLADLNSQLIAARAERAEAEARFNQVRRVRSQGGAAAAANAVSSPLILTLRQQRAELIRREAELSTRYGDRHPRMINVRAEIADVNSAIAAEARKTEGGLRNDLEVARARERTLETNLRELERRSLTQSQGTVKLRQLQREAEADKLIYENFLTRFKETSEQEDLQQADARIISPAKESIFSGTSEKRVLAIAGAAGMALGLCLLFLFEKLNNTFRHEQDVEDSTGVTVLASLPRFGRRSRRSQVLAYVRDKPTSALAEGIRNLRTALFLSNIDKPPKVVMITSSLAAEAKSTTCLLLAEMTTLMGRRAIIVDCDIRRPTLYQTFGIQGEHDIISVLDGSAELEDVIHVDPDSNLHILPALKSAPQAADILSSKRFATLIERLSEHYDLVLLDSPPILLVSDAGVVGKYADATVYAVRWDKTPRDAAARGIKQLRDLGVSVNGVALTLVDRKRQARYNYYQYGYNYYQNAYYSD